MANTPLPSLFGRFTAILSDHRDLGATLAMLERACAAPEHASSASGDALGPIDLLEKLAAELPEHFQAEEGAGYFGAIVRDRPALGQQVQGLAHEHVVMLSEVLRLLAIARDRARHAELPAAVREFVLGFRKHEAEETALLREFFLRSEG